MILIIIKLICEKDLPSMLWRGDAVLVHLFDCYGVVAC
ncbi:hypothetical protein B4Q23_1907c [Lacticaseibacillus paracasei]|jgi:hypothetical protein|nr:hypothetical protein BWK52_2115c [Lacticaseibacillus paracasei]OUC72312.1 hypothetical protein B4Q23_1907c [Lacticaseibacillus paracasei]